MKTKAMITMLVSVAMILTTPIVTLGARPADKGPPNGGGGGSAGDAAGALYGDLYVIERDGKGEPITRLVATDNCLQPLAKDCALLPLWGECDLEPGDMPSGVLPLPECEFDPELYDACAVYAGTEEDPDPTYTDQLQTVKFGRASVSRSPATVIDKSYAEALKAINQAVPDECPDAGAAAIKLDPAGRLTLCIPQEDSEDYAWKTIDSPLENLGLYRAVMTDGCFSPITQEVGGAEGGTSPETTELSEGAEGFLDDAELGHLVCNGGTSLIKPDMLSAATFLGAAADKTSPITLDEIINLNTYVGVNTYTYRREKKETFLDVTYFEFTDFTYLFGTDACNPDTTATLLNVTGGDTFRSAPTNVFGASPPGVALRDDQNTTEDVEGVAITVCRSGYSLDVVCDGVDNQVGCSPANLFAQAAEDARKTIWYLHNFEVPELAY